MLNSVNKISGNTLRWKHLSKSHTTSSRPKSTPIRGQTSQSNEPIPMCVCLCLSKSWKPIPAVPKVSSIKVMHSPATLARCHDVRDARNAGTRCYCSIALLGMQEMSCWWKSAHKMVRIFPFKWNAQCCQCFFCVPTVHLRDGKKELSPHQKSHHLAWHGFWNTKPQSH